MVSRNEEYGEQRTQRSSDLEDVVAGVAGTVGIPYCQPRTRTAPLRLSKLTRTVAASVRHSAAVEATACPARHADAVASAAPASSAMTTGPSTPATMPREATRAVVRTAGNRTRSEGDKREEGSERRRLRARRETPVRLQPHPNREPARSWQSPCDPRPARARSPTDCRAAHRHHTPNQKEVVPHAKREVEPSWNVFGRGEHVGERHHTLVNCQAERRRRGEPRSASPRAGRRHPQETGADVDGEDAGDPGDCPAVGAMPQGRRR